MKTKASWLFCYNLLLACNDIPSHDCQHKGAPSMSADQKGFTSAECHHWGYWYKNHFSYSCFRLHCHLGFCWERMSLMGMNQYWGHLQHEVNPCGQSKPQQLKTTFPEPSFHGLEPALMCGALEGTEQGRISKHQIGSCSEKPKGECTWNLRSVENCSFFFFILSTSFMFSTPCDYTACTCKLLFAQGWMS